MILDLTIRTVINCKLCIISAHHIYFYYLMKCYNSMYDNTPSI